MKKVILITGANGMLAKALSQQLEGDYTVRFLTRNKSQANEFLWDLNSQYIDTKALVGVHAVIHLAGASIAGKRWTKKRKNVILTSRVDSANLIFNELKKNKLTIDTFISASAIGFYGTQSNDIIFDEDSPKGNDFLSNVCAKWEQAANNFKLYGVASSTSIVRIGIILANNQGALKKIMQPIKYGFGAAIGSGNQYVPWIHINDLIGIFKHILDNSNITGTFNAVSPQHVTNMELTKTIASIINKPLVLPNIPKFMMQMLFGEMATMLLEGNKISSEKIEKAGFRFKYEKLLDAINSIIID